MTAEQLFKAMTDQYTVKVPTSNLEYEIRAVGLYSSVIRAENDERFVRNDVLTLVQP